MKTTLTFIQILISTLLMVLILLQPQGQGLGILGGWGQEAFRSKRGLEKLIFQLTIIFAIALLVSLIGQLLISNQQ